MPELLRRLTPLLLGLAVLNWSCTTPTNPPPPQPPSDPTWRFVNPLGGEGALWSAWGSAPDNIFAAGGAPGAAKLLHFDGASWTQVDVSIDEPIFDIFGVSASDIVMVGGAGTVYRFDGTNWNQEVSGTTLALRGVWSDGAGTWYAVGNVGVVVRYTAGSWAPMSTGSFDQQLWAVWGSNANDVFAVGSNGSLLRFDGVSWTQDITVAAGTNNLLSVWGSAADDVYVGGVAGILRHYDGASWTTPTSASGDSWAITGTSATDVRIVGSAEVLYFDGSTWMSSSSPTDQVLFDALSLSNGDVIAVGSSGTMMRYNGSWHYEVGGNTETLESVWMAPLSDAFAVGTNGTIVRSRPNGNVEFYDTGVVAHLNDIEGISVSEITAVGHGGTILQFNGASWQLESSGVGEDLLGLWLAPDGSRFAVGVGGTILRDQGAGWVAQVSNTTATLREIWGSALDDIYVVGDDGAASYYDGVKWSAITIDGSPGEVYYKDIEGFGSDLVFVAVEAAAPEVPRARHGGGRVLEFDGEGWEIQFQDPSQDTWGFKWFSPSSAVRVGFSGFLAEYDGVAWNNVWANGSGPTDTQLREVDGTGSDDVVVVGSGGVILRLSR